jgi:hypothetical protein
MLSQAAQKLLEFFNLRLISPADYVYYNLYKRPKAIRRGKFVEALEELLYNNPYL